TLSPRVEMRYMIPAIGHPDRPHFDVLAEVLSEVMKDMLQSTKISGSVNVNTRVVHTSRFGVPATMNIEVVLANENDLPVCERVMLDVFDRIQRETIAREKLQMAKKRLRTAWYRTALSADRLAFEIGHFQVMDHWSTLKKHLDARETTTVDDLQRLAKQYFIPKNRSVGIVRKPEHALNGKEVVR
ncbi:MAG: insulinase family protein, partial [bacterium]